MRVEIEFYVNEDRKLRNYVNEAITAYIYRAIKISDREFAKKMHDEGIKNIGPKKFNYYTYTISQNTTHLQKDIKKGIVKLVLSSAIDDLIINFVKGMFKIGKIQIFGKSYEIMNVKHETKTNIKGDSNMFFIPNIVYGEGAGRVWLNKKEMEIQIADNLVGKYYALYNKLPKKDTRVKLLNCKHGFYHYKKDKFRGFKGNVIIEGDNKLIQLAYNAGIGSKTGLGLGLLIQIG